VGLDRAAAVLGNAEVLQAELLRGGRHFFERVVAIAGGCMAMERAAQILGFNQSRKFPRGGSLELAAILPQLRRDVIELERAIKVRLFMNRRNWLRNLLF
jgi:hypothetical protein